MNTECYQEHIPSILNIKAIKVDGNQGLKYLITKDSIKSCDYLKLKKNDVFLIEFSCLNSQLVKLNGLAQYQNSAGISNTIKKSSSFKKMYPLPAQVIEDEIREKISDSLILFELIKKKCNLANDVKRDKKFLVGICSARPSDVQIFDSITRKLQKRYNRLFKRVAIVSYLDIENIFPKKGSGSMALS